MRTEHRERLSKTRHIKGLTDPLTAVDCICGASLLRVRERQKEPEQASYTYA